MDNKYTYDEWKKYIISYNISTCNLYYKWYLVNKKLPNNPEEYYGKIALPILLWKIFNPNISSFDSSSLYHITPI